VRANTSPAPAQQLRKILAFESEKGYSDNSVIGGLDAYLRNFVAESSLPLSHRLPQILGALPAGGYRALHPVQRRRVVEELLKALSSGVPVASARQPQPPARTLAPEEPRRTTRAPARSPVVGTLDSPVTVLNGVSRVTAAKLARLNIHTVRDILFHFPGRYDEFAGVQRIADLRPGDNRTIIGKVRSSGVNVIGRRREVSEAIISDGSGSIRVIWWSGRWMARRLKEGMTLALTGKVAAFGGRLTLENPELESPDDESLQNPRIIPVYGATEGLAQRDLRGKIAQAVTDFAMRVEDELPRALRERFGFPEAPVALCTVHSPASLADAEAARARFAFEELLHVELGVVKRRKEWEAAGGAVPLPRDDSIQRGFVDSLPFRLTRDQRAAIDEIAADIAKEAPMSRLLEGDVGSGKTVVAATALLAAVVHGCQGAIMAPTEILAEQHFRTLCRLLDPDAGDEKEDLWFREAGRGYLVLRPPYLDRPLRIALLRGSLTAGQKEDARRALASGDVDIAVGTHALVQRGVEFRRLAIAVVDEQHRFGVAQRAALREKGESPHVLAMTATPIPRTLALTVYGDLDITVLKEMPPGRPPVKTYRLVPRQRDQAYDFVRKRVEEGRQAYVICPLVEESEAIEAKAAVQEYERLSRDVFPGLNLGLLHGRMSSADKEATMRAFDDSRLDVLVSTAVVEVGIDVPNATVMLIEGADRFGLTQLHQFRGRVRRSERQSHCLLLSENPSPEAQERLQIMVNVSDGFRLAEEDLRLRGSGDYFGTRQSGMPDLRLAKLTDVDLIMKARSEATRIVDEDPELAQPEHGALAKAMRAFWDRVSAEVS